MHAAIIWLDGVTAKIDFKNPTHKEAITLLKKKGFGFDKASKVWTGPARQAKYPDTGFQPAIPSGFEPHEFKDAIEWLDENTAKIPFTSNRFVQYSTARWIRINEFRKEEARRMLKEKGFRYDPETKLWEREKVRKSTKERVAEYTTEELAGMLDSKGYTKLVLADSTWSMSKINGKWEVIDEKQTA